MPRVAAVDCGTNSLRLLVTDMTRVEGARLTQADVRRQMEIVRLGEGVDRTGLLSEAAMARTLDALGGYARMIGELGVDAVRMVATSAVRDAANADAFVAACRRVLGVEPEVIPGEEEAHLSFVGATASLPDLASPCLVVDIGGGSTEAVLGVPETGEVLAARSVDVGCVRLSERHLYSDPPAPAELIAMRVDVHKALDDIEVDVPLARAASLVGVAGTVTTLAAATLDLPRYDAGVIHGSTHAPDDVLAACTRVLAASRQERRSWPWLHPGRVDVIAAGAAVWAGTVERVVALSDVTAVVVSEHDILDGVAASLLPATAPVPGPAGGC